MKQYYYVYIVYGQDGISYIGQRTSAVLPHLDIKYWGSFKDKTFKPIRKDILAVLDSHKAALQMEIWLHAQYRVAANPNFANRAQQLSCGFTTLGTGKKYAWINKKTGAKIEATVSELFALHKINKIDKSNLYKVIAGKLKSHKNWCIH